jgi:hypothetical protein
MEITAIKTDRLRADTNASHATLTRAGLEGCGFMLLGEVRPPSF